MNLTLSSPNGEINLVPESCEPGLVGPIGEGGFLHWCDVSGLLSVRVEGPTDFAQQIYDDLMISNVHLAGSTG